MTRYERVVSWVGVGSVVVGGFLTLVWVRTLVGDRPPRPMPVEGLGAFWLGNGGVTFLGLGWLVRAAARQGSAARVGRPLAATLAAIGAHRLVSGLLAPEVRAWMGFFLVPEGLLLFGLAGYLWWGHPGRPGGTRRGRASTAPSATASTAT